MADQTILYDYWRSSASYRVRIALATVGEAYRSVDINLVDKANRSAAHLARNPQGLVPALAIDGLMLTQSLAIIEYLDETRPGHGLLPDGAVGRQRVRALSAAIAMEIHPVCNLSVTEEVARLTGGGDAIKKQWMQTFIRKGLLAFEQLLDHPSTGTFCHGDSPTMADMVLVPQVYNARRWEVELDGLERCLAIADRASALPAFAASHPDQVKARQA